MDVKPLKLEVNVLQQDIDKGEQEEATSCAIARRLSRMELENVDVDTDTIQFDYQGQHYVARTPARASNFIEKFDETKADVKPFTFNIVAKPEVDEVLDRDMA